MIIIGRLTKDAVVDQLKDERKVVNFTIAVDDSYKPKSSEVVKKVVNYFNCSYWINAGIGEYLTKGTLVELFGHIGVNTWTNASGEAKASLNFHVSNIKLHGKGKSGRNTSYSEKSKEQTVDVESDVADDLPF